MIQHRISYYELLNLMQYMIIKRGYGNQMNIQPVIINNHITNYIVYIYKENKVYNFYLTLNDVLHMVRDYYLEGGYYVTHIDSGYEDEKLYYEINMMINNDKKELTKRDV